jgi:release factor glutamine methyltransferase
MVDRRVLIPRPETEEVVEVALGLARQLPAPRTVVDLGTGSGAIALSLAAELPLGSTTVWATELSADAADVARANVAGLGRPAAHVRVAEGSWYDALPHELRGAVDLVVANPPYVAPGDEVDAAVAAWEPALALWSGADGLDAVREIAAGAPTWLRPGGWLVLEIGATQGAAAAGILATASLTDVSLVSDVGGRERIATARRRGD